MNKFVIVILIMAYTFVMSFLTLMIFSAGVISLALSGFSVGGLLTVVLGFLSVFTVTFVSVDTLANIMRY